MSERFDELEERLRGHYSGARLDERELESLRAAIGEWEAQPAPRRPRRVAWLAAAALLVALALGALAWQALTGGGRPEWDSRAAAEELAQHHLHNLPPEFESDSVAGLRPLMPRLGFVPFDPEEIAGDGLRVLGGRYCSLSSAPALQVALTDPAGRPCTLYELRLDDALPDGGSVEHVVGHLRIRLWRDGELLIGLAQPR